MIRAYPAHCVALRWTVGDVCRLGFEALRLSLLGAWRLFGPEAEYTVCVNSIPVSQAIDLTGDVPEAVVWRDASRDLPQFIAARLDEGMAEGVGWKLAPVRLSPDRYELALDNDCILWDLPAAIRDWLDGIGSGFLIAEDVRAMFGRFTEFCGTQPRNSGLRGLPPGDRFEATLRDLLQRRSGRLTSELDEQGLQVAALSRCGEPHVVSLEDVTICSPFPPLQPNLGRCGAHFVGLNARQLPWDYYGRPAVDVIQEHWERHRDELLAKVGCGAEAQRTSAPQGRAVEHRG